MLNLKKADKRAKMDDVSGNRNPQVVVVTLVYHADVSRERAWKARLLKLPGLS